MYAWLREIGKFDLSESHRTNIRKRCHKLRNSWWLAVYLKCIKININLNSKWCFDLCDVQLTTSETTDYYFWNLKNSMKIILSPVDRVSEYHWIIINILYNEILVHFPNSRLCNSENIISNYLCGNNFH